MYVIPHLYFVLGKRIKIPQKPKRYTLRKLYHDDINVNANSPFCDVLQPQ